MFSTGKHPNRHLHAAFFDLILAVGAIKPTPWVVDGELSYGRHRKHRR